MRHNRVLLFPLADWSSITDQHFIEIALDWFKTNYKKEPQMTMQCLLDYVFVVLGNARGVEVYSNIVMELGKHLNKSKILQTDTGNNNPHHQRIVALLERGIQSRHSHFFMLPQIDKQSLLERPDYSSLVLAIKYCASGDYQKAREIALKICRGCSLALFIVGQSERKLGLYDQAQVHLNEGLKIIEQNACICPFGKNAIPICNDPLLKAVMLRAKAVVCRSLGQVVEAEKSINLAISIADEVMKNELLLDRAKQPETTNILWVEFGNKNASCVAIDVVADIYFSYGHYWYQLKDYIKADLLFGKAISALEQSTEEWDAPYTRLAIVKFCKGDYKKARIYLVKAHSICEKTPVKVNREAPLSLALCTLGLKVIEALHSDRLLTANDPISDLERAINLEPELAYGPLECHFNDACHFLEVSLPKPAETIVINFLNILFVEIRKIKPSFTSSFFPETSAPIKTPVIPLQEHKRMKKTIVELDLRGYSDIARDLEEHLSADVVMHFNEQIQKLVDDALTSVGVSREIAVMATTGDGAILVFDEPLIGHKFSVAIHNSCREHNQTRTVEAAKRWFRIGIATGELAINDRDGIRNMAGSVIARAVRLESAANIGEILADLDTYSELSSDIQAQYGVEELVHGKRNEKFHIRRYVVVPGLAAKDIPTKVQTNMNMLTPIVKNESSAVKRLRDKIAYFQNELAKASGAAQKFELKCDLEEAQQMLIEFSGS